ncbi:hypothetical protein QYF36_027222 [Acer negundo]|nr:hypothetical protein QYF36_027222 [Acer negundo]
MSCDNRIELAILYRKFRAGARIAVIRKGGGDNFSNKKGDSDVKGRLEAKDTWFEQRIENQGGAQLEKANRDKGKEIWIRQVKERPCALSARPSKFTSLNLDNGKDKRAFVVNKDGQVIRKGCGKKTLYKGLGSKPTRPNYVIQGNAATLTKNVTGCSNESALVALEDKDGESEGVDLCPNMLTNQDFVQITIDVEEDFLRNMLLKKRRGRKPEYSLKSQSGISVKPHCMKTRNHKAGEKEPQNEGVAVAQSEKVVDEAEILHTGFLCKPSSSINS